MSIERVRVEELGESKMKIVDKSILFFSRVSLSKIKNLFVSSLHFVGIRVFIEGWMRNVKGRVSIKQGILVTRLAIGMSHELPGQIGSFVL